MVLGEVARFSLREEKVRHKQGRVPHFRGISAQNAAPAPDTAPIGPSQAVRAVWDFHLSLSLRVAAEPLLRSFPISKLRNYEENSQQSTRNGSFKAFAGMFWLVFSFEFTKLFAAVSELCGCGKSFTKTDQKCCKCHYLSVTGETETTPGESNLWNLASRWQSSALGVCAGAQWMLTGLFSFRSG